MLSRGLVKRQNKDSNHANHKVEKTNLDLKKSEALMTSSYLCSFFHHSRHANEANVKNVVDFKEHGMQVLIYVATQNPFKAVPL